MAETLRFDFYRSRLKVTVENEDWLKRLDSAFYPFAMKGESEAKPEFSLSIHETDTPVFEHSLPLSWEGMQPDGLIGRVFEDGDLVVHEVEQDVTLRIDHGSRHAQAHVRPNSERVFFGTAVMQLAEAAISAGGQNLVHAACLVEAASGKAIMFSVPSGGGKTTTSLALARNGFALVSDDVSVLVPDEAGPLVWGIPRAAKVHWRTARMLPWLGPFSGEWNEEGEQGIQLQQLANQVALAGPGPVQLGAVVHIGSRRDGEHRFAPMAKGEVLVELAHENVPWRKAGMLPRAVGRFGAFATTLSRVPTFVLNAGTDLASLPDAVRAGLGNVLKEERSLP